MAWGALATLADRSYTTEQLRRRGQQAASVGALRALKPAVPFAKDANHSAFPSMVMRDDGILILIYREGSDHVNSRDGKIMGAASTDLGRTWGAAVALVTPPAGTDLRDPCVSKSVDGTKLYMSYFKATAALAAAGAFFRTSTDGGATWSAETRVDNLPYAASTAPVVELANGRLLLAMYGHAAGETWDSVYVGSSTDGGATWATTRIVNGVTLGAHQQEPWISRKPGADNLVMTFRTASSTDIGVVTTSNVNGTGWSALSVVCDGSGRPSTVWLDSGEILLTYRNSGGGTYFLARACTDAAATLWQPLLRVRPTPGSLWTYGHGIDVGGGVALVSFAEEYPGSTTSRIYLTTMARGGAATPLGPIPSDALAVAADYDRLEYSTQFREVRGNVLPDRLTVANGSFTLEETAGFWRAMIRSTSADNVPDRAYVELGQADVDIEADLYQTVQSGFGLIARMVDANNFLLLTSETTGANLRLYKFVAGVATQLGTLAAACPLSAWHTLRISARGPLITCYRNGQQVLQYSLAAGAEQTSFLAATRHGFQLNAQSTGMHYCRRFAVWGG